MIRTFMLSAWCGLIVAVYSQGASAANPDEKKIQGIVEPFRFADISPEISGRIVEISISEGRTALYGDTILKIEYTEDSLLADRARMAAENKADLKAARLKMEMTKLEYDATQLVYDSTSAVSEEELWGKKYQYEAALAEYEQLTEKKEQERVEYSIAKARLKTHFIIAPYRCVIASIKLHQWEHCTVAQPLVSVVDESVCRFVTYVPLSLIQQLATGKKVKLQVAVKNGWISKVGTVDFISPVADPESDLFTVKIKFDNTDNSVNPGVTGFLLIDE
jgi:RND family efflux transporter MFP subunit